MRATIGFSSAIAAGQSLALILARTEVRSTAAFGGSLSTARLGVDAARPTMAAAPRRMGIGRIGFVLHSSDDHRRSGATACRLVPAEERHAAGRLYSLASVGTCAATFPFPCEERLSRFLAVGPTQAS